jgi:DNA-binding NarL/FixJ family response regulator
MRTVQPESISDVKVVAQASNGQEAVTMFRQHQPDLTLMDLRMSVMDGVAAIAAICAEFPSARIVLLTTYDGDENIYRGLQAGAKGYLLKDAELEELLAAIRAVFEGKKYIPLAVGVKLADRLGGPELSDRELEVIRPIVAGKSNHHISKVLHISESSVKFQLNNILSKMAVSDRTQPAISALKRGIVSL